MLAARPALAAALLCAALLVPPAAADDHDPVSHAEAVAQALADHAMDGVGLAGSLLPACTASDPEWDLSCTSEEGDQVACASSGEDVARCSLLRGGKGGEVDGSAATGLATLAAGVAAEAAARAGTTAGRVLAEGAGAAVKVVSDANSAAGWAASLPLAVVGFAGPAAAPFIDTATALGSGIASDVQEFSEIEVDLVLEATHAAIGEAVGANERFSASSDSGPLTLAAGNRQPADDCSGQPEHGLRVLGHDCSGPVYLDTEARAAAECNAYTVMLSQPCGGWASTDWSWWVEGNALHPSRLGSAQLRRHADGRTTVHDASGVLHCDAPEGQNGYWFYSAHVEATESTFKEKDGDDLVFSTGRRENVVLVERDAGDCAVTPSGSGYSVVYEVEVHGQPLRMAGTFQPDGDPQALAECSAGADAQADGLMPPGYGCTSALRTGGR